MMVNSFDPGVAKERKVHDVFMFFDIRPLKVYGVESTDEDIVSETHLHSNLDGEMRILRRNNILLAIIVTITFNTTYRSIFLGSRYNWKWAIGPRLLCGHHERQTILVLPGVGK